MSFNGKAIGEQNLRDRKTKPGFFRLTSKGFTQIDYIIATGIFLVVFALVVQYVAGYFSDVTATTNIRVMTTQSNDLLSLADRGFDPPDWPYFTPNDSVLLYMHLDNNTLDSSRYGNNGTIQGANCSLVVIGKIHGGCELDGIDDYINITNSPVFNFSDSASFSVAAWFNVINFTILPMSVVSKQTNVAVPGWDIVVGSDGDFHARVGVSNTVTINTEYYINKGVWNHAVLTVNRKANTSSLYLNGVAVNDSANISLSGSLDSAEPVKIGRRNTQYFNGTIDEVIIFNRSLATEEVKQLYAYETTVNRLGLATKVYRFQIIVNNSRQAWKNQALPWVNITDEQVVFNYSDIGLPASVSSTTIYDDSGNNVAYNINGRIITFNTSIVTNSTKNFTVYFDDDANFVERSISVAGNDNLTETILPAQKIDVLQYKKILLLNGTNYTLVRNTTQMPRDFHLTLLDMSGSAVIDYGAAAPPSGNIVASRRFVVYQNSTGGIRRGTLNVQVW